MRGFVQKQVQNSQLFYEKATIYSLDRESTKFTNGYKKNTEAIQKEKNSSVSLFMWAQTAFHCFLKKISSSNPEVQG